MERMDLYDQSGRRREQHPMAQDPADSPEVQGWLTDEKILSYSTELGALRVPKRGQF